jgi:hypothetical protein
MTGAQPTLWQRVCYTRLTDAVRGRFDASLDWRLVVAEAKLPPELAAVVGQVVTHSRLWRREKVAVAAELIAHFQDGLEAGESPESLARSFGDARQTAILIRRAKKRNRSVAWHLWRYGCWTIGAIAIAYIAAGLWMLLDRPTVKTDYLAILNEHARAVPENERAWPLYRKALLASGAHASRLESDPVNLASSAKPDDANWPEAEQFLLGHADALAKLREAAGRRDLGLLVQTSPGAIMPEDRILFGIRATPEDIEAAKKQTAKDHWLVATHLPHASLLQTAAGLLANDARRAAAAGDGDTAMADVMSIYGLSRHCQETPFLVNMLVAEHAQQRARAAIEDILRKHPTLWSDDQLRDLAHQTAGSQIDWRRAFDGERASFYDSMQRVYTDDGHGDGRLALNVDASTASQSNFFELLNSVTNSMTDGKTATPLSNSVLAMLAMPATNMVVASRREMTDMHDRLADRALDQMETPLWETPEGSSIDDEVNSWNDRPLTRFRYLFISLLLPSYDGMRHAYASSEGQREGLMIGLALELYHRQHGKWPESLAELTPRWLPELPVDRITGKPLLYRIVGDRPIVYSAGVDSDDDGGRLPAYYSERGLPYSVGPPQQTPLNATDEMKAQFDGDWIIWSTQK